MERCGCGQPLHYTNPAAQRAVEEIVEALGPLVKVVVIEGAWIVPRHYIALHGIKADEVKRLAEWFGWEQV